MPDVLAVISDVILSATVLLLAVHVNLLSRRQKQLLDRLRPREKCIVEGCERPPYPQNLAAPGAAFCPDHSWSDV